MCFKKAIGNHLLFSNSCIYLTFLLLTTFDIFSYQLLRWICLWVSSYVLRNTQYLACWMCVLPADAFVPMTSINTGKSMMSNSDISSGHPINLTVRYKKKRFTQCFCREQGMSRLVQWITQWITHRLQRPAG